MASGWQNKLARVSRMDWEEVRVRAGQELHKHRDLLMHRMGFRNGEAPLRTDSSARPGQFFFSGDEGAGRAELLRKHLPDEAASILHEADEICGHRFRLLGYENLDFSVTGKTEIDWHLDPVHGKRAPKDPWFKIPFLDFAVVGDHKITWELNRHQHLVTLAKAALLSGDEKYLRELMAQWRSWIKTNPYPLGINWGSSLEVAFRSLSWVWVDQFLAATELAGPRSEFASELCSELCSEFRLELLPALAFHGRYIERYLSTYFSPNTHLLGEAVALFFLGTLYPQMPEAARWKKSGWEIVLHEAGRQVRPDGVYFEQSLHYHVYALDFFLYARLLAARNGIEIPSEFDAVLERMLDVVAALAQAGPAEGFGDDDGGRLFNPRRNQTEQMTDPLALGALIYSRQFSAARLTEEAIWLFGNQAVEQLSQMGTSLAAHSISFPDGGIYVLGDSQPYPQVMVVDAGPQGVGRSGHGHADALSLRFTMDGRRWLVDSGSGVYISKDPADRNTLRGTGAHNTMRVDAVDQAIADEPFSWTNIPATLAETFIAGKSFTYFAGSHNGYARLTDPVVHRRQVLQIAGGVWLVRDIALGHAEHELELRWHFAPDLEVQTSGLQRVEVTRAEANSSESGLTLIMPEETVWHSRPEVSQTTLSPAYGMLRPAPLLRYHARIMLPAETATALISHLDAKNGKNNPNFDRHSEPRMTSTAQGPVQIYELEYDGESHAFFFALGDDTWSSGPWSSDAQVLYCRSEEQRLTHLIVIGGTHVAWQGQPLLRVVQPSTFFEWRKQDVETGAVPDEFITALFEQLTGGALAGKTRSTADMNRDSSSYAEKH